MMDLIRQRLEVYENNLKRVTGIVRENRVETTKFIDKADKDILFISFDLMSSDFDHKSFRPMIVEFFDRIEKQGKMAFRYHVGKIPPLPNHYRVILFRIIKEMLNNTIKHAKATEANFNIFYDRDEAEIKVILSDNGKGFDDKKMKVENRGVGLNNVEIRVGYLKGKLEIRSDPFGTTVLVSTPVELTAYERF
jgi:signal transduction histidine kinase